LGQTAACGCPKNDYVHSKFLRQNWSGPVSRSSSSPGPYMLISMPHLISRAFGLVHAIYFPP